MTAKGRYWLAAAAVLLALAAPAGAQNRLSYMNAEVRRCKNFGLSNPRFMALMAAQGVSLDQLCNCEAGVVVGMLTPAEGDQLLHGGGLPTRLAEPVEATLKYCLTLQ